MAFYCQVCGKAGSKEIYAELKRRGLISRVKGRRPDMAAEDDYWADFEPVLPVPAGTIDPDFYAIFKRQPTKVWAYRDAAGELLFYEARFDLDDGKQFCSVTRWRSKYDDEAEVWAKRDLPVLRPLYGLDRLAASPDKPVIVCEGAKSADAAELIFPHCIAVTSIKGATAPTWSDWSPLAGRTVIIWPDHDGAGEKFAKVVAGLLARADAESIKIVQIPEALPDKWDLADAVPEGVDVDLRALLDGAAVFDGGDAGGGNIDPSGFVCGASGMLKNVHGNIRLAIKLLGVELHHNDFTDCNEIKGLPPFADGELQDFHGNRLRFMIDEQFKCFPAPELLEAVITDICYTHNYHPVIDYFDGLAWDGTDRVDTWPIVYLGVEDTPLNRAIVRAIAIAAVRRIKKPGTKFDQLPVLEGPQGIEKSSAVESLVPDETWFTDALPIGADSKHTIEQTQGIWVAEIAELQGKDQKELDRIKTFLSRRTDRARKAYAHRPTSVPRQFLAIGTTNDDKYLRDNENWRYWPLKVGTIMLEKLRHDRDQLWAEAVVLEARGELIVLPRELWGAAAIEQDKRKVDNVYFDFLLHAYGDAEHGAKGWIKAVNVRKFLDLHIRERWNNNQFGEAMRLLGFTREQVTKTNDDRGERGARFYQRGTWAEAQKEIENKMRGIGPGDIPF